MRCFEFLTLLLAGALQVAVPAAPAPAAPAAPAPAASPQDAPVVVLERFESGAQATLAGDLLSVIEDGEPVFEARLQTWSSLSGVAEDAPAPVARAFSWSYPHLLDILFLDLSAEAAEPVVPALGVEATEGLELVRRSIQPHDGMGAYPARPVEYWQRMRDRGGVHEYLAVLRLDQIRPTARDGGLYTFDEAAPRGSTLSWPLAVVRAPTQRELQMRVGQALLAFDGAGERKDPQEWWRVPALCGLCQQQQVREIELDLQDRGSSLLLRVRTTVEYPDHARASAEGMRIDDMPLARWLSGEQGDEAWFVVPLDVPLADALINVAVNGGARVQARLSTGVTVEVPTVRVQLDPAFEERIYSREKVAEPEDWPNHLAADLVSSWPNPFRDSTTIEVRVPGTIEEAFELGPELLARVEPGSPPPFGTSPTVRVKVYNVSGQLVNVLDQGPRPVGRFTVGWNGQDLQGRPVASGAYYVHVEMEEWSVTRRVLLLRN